MSFRFVNQCTKFCFIQPFSGYLILFISWYFERFSKTFFRLLPIFSLLCIAGLSAKAQTIRAVVADRTTKAPISDVFVFLSNSSIGTATDESGTFELSLQETKEIVLVFSHINYELLTLEIPDAAITRDTFLLQPNQVELNEAVVVERSRSGLRNRRLKAFSKAFLGEDTKDKQVQINNPDVLLFRQAKDRLIAAAKEPLIIENRELGYTVQFYLEAFELFVLLLLQSDDNVSPNACQVVPV